MVRRKIHPLARHHEKGKAIVERPDGSQFQTNRAFAEYLVETNKGYKIVSVKPSKRPWR